MNYPDLLSRFEARIATAEGRARYFMHLTDRCLLEIDPRREVILRVSCGKLKTIQMPDLAPRGFPNLRQWPLIKR